MTQIKYRFVIKFMEIENLPKYSGVPHSVHVLSFNFLAKPKSVIFKWPSRSINKFSGFKSRYTIDNECKYSSAKIISLA